VTLNAPNADFAFLMADHHLIILPAAEGGIDWSAGVGTGPYGKMPALHLRRRKCAGAGKMPALHLRRRKCAGAGKMPAFRLRRRKCAGAGKMPALRLRRRKYDGD
jgi:hypothetical protein